MICKSCGTDLDEGQQYCKICGADVKALEELENQEEAEEFSLDDIKYDEYLKETTIDREKKIYINKLKNYRDLIYVYRKRIIAIFVIFLGLLVGLLAYSLLRSYNQYKTKKYNPYEDVTNKRFLYGIKGLNGYVFENLKDYKYIKNDNLLTITSPNDDWGIMIEVADYTYDNLKNNISLIIESYKNKGYTVNTFNEKILGGHTYLISEMNKDGKNVVIGITPTNNDQVFVLMSFASDYSISYSGYQQIANLFNKYEFDKNYRTNKKNSKIYDFTNIN